MITLTFLCQNMGPFNSYTSTNGQRVKAGVLPSELKKDKIVPSYTQIKNKETLQNYCPLLELPICWRILESLMLN